MVAFLVSDDPASSARRCLLIHMQSLIERIELEVGHLHLLMSKRCTMLLRDYETSCACRTTDLKLLACCSWIAGVGINRSGASSA